MASEAALRDERVRVRHCRWRDRPALRRLGHPPDVVRLLCPSLATRLLWAATGTVARALVAEEAGTGEVCGAIQLVRSRQEHGTWMFGHWRVLSGRRRGGIGRRLLAGGLRLVPEARRLFSVVERGNEASRRAHEHLGFESASPLAGSAELGALSAIGAPAPSVRLEPVARKRRASLFPLYRRATGELWMRLFPGLNCDNFLQSECDPALPGPPPRSPAGRGAGAVLAVHAGGTVVGFVVRRRKALGFYGEPSACDAGLLARVALQAIDRGAPRDTVIGLRGLPRELVGRPGPVAFRVVMALIDVAPLGSGNRDQ